MIDVRDRLLVALVATMLSWGACSSDSANEPIDNGTGGGAGTSSRSSGGSSGHSGASGGRASVWAGRGYSGAWSTSGGSGGSSGGSTGSGGTCVAGSTEIGNTCQSGWSAIIGKYTLNNNWWGASGATGEQCVWGTCQDGDVVGWVTNWNWSGAPARC
jgi:xyloglucan-specific endo-beta-1,4-glucanase